MVTSSHRYQKNTNWDDYNLHIRLYFRASGIHLTQGKVHNIYALSVPKRSQAFLKWLSLNPVRKQNRKPSVRLEEELCSEER